MYSFIFPRSSSFQLTPSRRATELLPACAEPAEKFQLTPSRRATEVNPDCIANFNISTHALTEGDITFVPLCVYFSTFQLTPSRRATTLPPAPVLLPDHFNSRPHGGRPLFPGIFATLCIFQLTPSRRATLRTARRYCVVSISTHALTEGDEPDTLTSNPYRYFNSRPHGGRLFVLFRPVIRYISTHALTEGDK